MALEFPIIISSALPVVDQDENIEMDLGMLHSIMDSKSTLVPTQPHNPRTGMVSLLSDRATKSKWNEKSPKNAYSAPVRQQEQMVVQKTDIKANVLKDSLPECTKIANALKAIGVHMVALIHNDEEIFAISNLDQALPPTFLDSFHDLCNNAANTISIPGSSESIQSDVSAAQTEVPPAVFHENLLSPAAPLSLNPSFDTHVNEPESAPIISSVPGNITIIEEETDNGEEISEISVSVEDSEAEGEETVVVEGEPTITDESSGLGDEVNLVQVSDHDYCGINALIQASVHDQGIVVNNNNLTTPLVMNVGQTESNDSTSTTPEKGAFRDVTLLETRDFDGEESLQFLHPNQIVESHQNQIVESQEPGKSLILYEQDGQLFYVTEDATLEKNHLDNPSVDAETADQNVMPSIEITTIDQALPVTRVRSKNVLGGRSTLNPYRSNRSKPGGHRCVICGNTYSRIDVLRNHQRIHIGDGRYSCSICNKSFLTISNLKRHAAVHNGMRWKCQYCGKLLSQLEKLRSHEKQHLKKKELSCSICGKEFWFKYELRQHLEKHNPSFKFMCEVCKTTFSDIASLRRHAPKCADKKHPCQVADCSSRFTTLSQLKKHEKRKHSLHMLPCKSCDKKFSHIRALRVHLKTHSPEKYQHTCEFCGEGFLQLRDLMQHQARHHGINNDKADSAQKTPFLKFKVRTVDEQIQAGVKDFACSYCDKSFYYFANLKKHQALNHSQAELLCYFCTKKFIVKYELERHEKRHLGEHNFICQYCGKGFVVYHDMVRHHRKSHPDKPGLDALKSKKKIGNYADDVITTLGQIPDEF